MNKFLQLLTLFLLLLSICGCSAQSVPPETTVPAVAEIPETLPFEFPLPEGYALAYNSWDSVSITKDGQVIGGIVLSDLHTDCVMDSKCRHLHSYLQRFVPVSQMPEYLSMRFDNEAYISLSSTNEETGERLEQSHHLFERAAGWFDYWVDTTLISTEEKDAIFKSIEQVEK